MRFCPTLSLLAVFSCSLLFTSTASAQWAALDTTPGKTSTTGVIVSVSGNVPSNGISTVNSFPYFFTATRTQGSTKGEFFPNFSQTGIQGFVQNSGIGDANATVSAPSTVYFTSPSGAAYEIHGLAGSALGATFEFELKDLTAGTTLYSLSKTATSISLDTSGGPVTGTLIKGHSFSLVALFEYSSGDSVPSPQASCAGSFELDFSQAPEPTTATLIPMLAIPRMLARSRRRARR